MPVVTRFPTANAATTLAANQWVNPNNAHADDGVLATHQVELSDSGRLYSGFGFDSAIPENSTIQAVKVTVKHKDGGSGRCSTYPRVSTVYCLLRVTPARATLTVDTNDHTADRAWTRDDLLDAQFDVDVIEDPVGVGGAICELDYVTVEVTYTAPDLNGSRGIPRHLRRFLVVQPMYTRPVRVIIVGNNYTQVVTGSLSFVGTVANRGGKNLVGGLGFTGSLVKAGQKVLAGALGFSGATLKATARSVAGVLSFTGAMTTSRVFGQLLTGALSFTGALLKSARKPITGTVSFVGGLSRAAGKVVSGVVSFSGAISRSTSRLLIGGLSFSGTLLRTAGRTFSGVLSFTGNLVGRAGKALAGTLSFIGSVSKMSNRALTAAVGFSGVLAAGIFYARSFTGAVSFVGGLIRRVGKAMAGVLTFGYKAHVLADAPFAYWRLGETSGTTASDSSGNARHGTYAGASLVLGKAGVSDDEDTAAYFTTNATMYVTSPDLSSYNEVSVEAWVKGTLVQSIVRQPGNAYFIFLSSGNTHEIRNGFPNTITVNSGTLNDDAWHYYVMTWKRNTTNGFKAYRDGALYAQVNANDVALPAPLNTNLYVASDNGSAAFATATIDEVVIHTTALSADRVASRYASGRALRLTRGRFKALNAALSLSGVLQGAIGKSFSGTLSFVGQVSRRVFRSLNATLSFVGVFFKRIRRPYSDAVLADSPIGYWRLGETTGTAAYDYSGNNRHGTYQGGYTQGQTPFIYDEPDKAVLLNGTTGTVKITGGLTLGDLSTFSVEAWCKGSYGQSMFRVQPGAYLVLGWGSPATAIRAILSNDGGVGDANNAIGYIDDGTWHHYVWTWISNTTNGLKTYKDATLVNQKNTTNVTTPSALTGADAYIGSLNASGEYLNGTIDEVAVYNTVLSPTRITAHYKAGRTYVSSSEGTLAFVGVTAAVRHLLMAGTLSLVGATSTSLRWARAFTASVSFTGAVQTVVGRVLGASLSFSGVLRRLTNRSLSGGLSFGGNLTRDAARSLAATLSFAGTAILTTIKPLAAVLSFSGGLVRRTSKAFAGVVSFAGQLIVPNAVQVALTAALSFSGSMAKSTIRQFSGAVSFSGQMTRLVGRALSASVSFTGSLARGTFKTLAGVVSFSGSLLRHQGKLLAATVGFVGNMNRLAVKPMSAALSFAGTLTNRTSRAFTAVLSFSGQMSKGAMKTVAGVLSFAGALATIGLRFRAFTATLSFAGSMVKRTSRAFTAGLSFSGALTQRLLWIQVQLAVLATTITGVHWSWRSIGVAMTEAVDMVFTHNQNAVKHNPYREIRIEVKGPQEMAYKRGTNVLFEATFTDKDGVNFNPDANTIRIYVKKPDGTYLTGYDPAVGNGAAMAFISLGVYQKDVQFARTDPVGQYEIEVQGSIGAKVSLDSVKINVRA